MNNKKQFLQLISSQHPDLATGALLIAKNYQPHINISDELAVIEQLALLADDTPVNDAHSLVAFFREAGFKGNSSEYYDVNNSFLNQVLTRKTGIPITLGVVYLSVVQRLHKHSFSAIGINFPGHFLIATDNGHGQQFIDVFDVKVTNKQECYERFSETGVTPDPNHFRRATDADILSRILENLKAIFWQAGQLDAVVDCLDYQLMIFPDSHQLLKQQQRLLNNLKHYDSSHGIH